MIIIFLIKRELKPRGRKTWEKFVGTIKSIQQQISFDMNGNPVWGVGLGAYTNPAISCLLVPSDI